MSSMSDGPESSHQLKNAPTLHTFTLATDCQMMTKAKILPYICLPFLLIAVADATARIESITTESGDVYEVPSGHYVYISRNPAFYLKAESPSGDYNFGRLTAIDGQVPDEDPTGYGVPECTTKGLLKYDPATKQWRKCGGTGWAINGPEMQAAGDAFADKEAEFNNSIGNYEPYLGSEPVVLRVLLTRNYWWRGRLHVYAEQVMSGDIGLFKREFWGRGKVVRAYALEVLNRYIALRNDGYTDEELFEIIWEGN